MSESQDGFRVTCKVISYLRVAFISILVGALGGALAASSIKRSQHNVIEPSSIPTGTTSRISEEDRSPVPQKSGNSLNFREAIASEGLWQLAIFVAISLSLIRLLKIALGDPQLAVSILQASGYAAPLAAIFFALLPFVILYAIVAFIVYNSANAEAYKLPVFDLRFVAVILWLLLLAGSIMPAYLFLLTAILIVVFIILDRLQVRQARKSGKQVSIDEYLRTRRRELFTTAVFGIVAAGIVPQILSEDPWVTMEELHTSAGNYYGVVLGEGEEWMVLLNNKPRQIRYLPLKNVLKREPCKGSDDKWSLTLPTILNKDNSLGGVDCPKMSH
ncbi:hypothetical protein AB0M95_01470 [Sphaerisporangium sp. NPDC051017]|uniref:hypothetical protein n=1 Tax=Sphaerisporangium sp. NPDC051017 TaxID=3154636 RepID=UPI0034493755